MLKKMAGTAAALMVIFALGLFFGLLSYRWYQGRGSGGYSGPALLKEVQLVDESDVGDGSVSTGTTVTLRYEGDSEDDTQQFFVGSIEERQGSLPVLSPGAPLGQVLMGKKAGDTVEYTAPGGMLRVEIVAVLPRLVSGRAGRFGRKQIAAPRFF